MEFKQLSLHEDLLKALDEAGFQTCMPVQEAVFAHSLSGEDIYAQSQTGTGKTAAFLVSILQRIATVPECRTRKALILAPTRELAVQIEEETKKLSKHMPISSGVFHGGVSYGPQVDMLKADVQIIIGTPGRIIDLIQQGKMLLKDVGFLVIDEADRMFDMGFIDDLRKLIRFLPPPAQRQTFLFSATLNVRVKNLAWEYMDEPKEIVIEPERVTVELVTQELYHVGSDEKMRLLLGILKRDKPESVLIFCNQKFMAEEVARRLGANGIVCEFIMGDLPQAKRLQVIEKLKAGQVEILVATDVAARGLDVEALDLVVNYDVPLDPESYVHRIGRTARAGKAGKAVTLACEKFVYGLPAIEKYIGARIPVLPFGEDLLAEDKSASMRFSHRHEEGRRDRGPSSRDRGAPSRDRGRGGLDRSGRGRRPERPSGRGGQDRRGGRADQQGISSIQRSIAEAAGRDLDPASAVGQGGGAGGQRPPRQGQGGQRPRDGKPRQDGARRDGDRRGGEAARTNQGRDGQRRDPRPAEGGANPYDLPMEERMKLYRERYGAKGGQGRDARQGQQRDRRDEKPRGEPASGQQGQRKQGGRGQGGQRQDQRRDGKSQQREPQRQPPQGQRPAQGQRKPEQAPVAAKKPGILDRLKNLFGGKKK